MEPLISVIIPNYTHAQYLDERIQSIINQTFQDFEIIILDDCSPDDSKVIIEKYRNHPKVSNIIYNEMNSGSTFIQWNKGFSFAKGEYIWIAESDDFCDEKILETLIKYISDSPQNVLAFTRSQFVDSIGKIIPPIIETKEDIIVSGENFISFYMTCGNKIWNASSAIFKKSILNMISCDYMNYKAAGDRLFWIEIARHGNVIMVNKPLNYFRQHEQKVSPKKLQDGTLFIEEHKIHQYLKQNGYINFLTDFFITNYYINSIYRNRNNFINDELFQKLLTLWDKPILVNSFLSRMINHIYIIIKSIFS